MIERVNSVIQMKAKLEVKYDVKVCSQTSRARYTEDSFGFYDSSMIMISGRP